MILFNVFDTETTGLPYHQDADLRKQPRIIEFAGIVTDGRDILHEYEFICNPGVEIEPIITQITGLTNDDLRDKPPFKEFLPGLSDYFSRGVGRIAHNLSFDKHMLMFDLARIDLDLTAIGYDGIDICTVEQVFPIYGKYKKLQDLYTELIGPYVQKHRALDDVKLLHQVARKIGVYAAFNGPEYA